MKNNNKKFWSLIFGAIMANSYVWIVDFGNNAPVPETIQSYTSFVLNYYSPMLIAITSALLAFVLSIVMKKGFNVCVSEHVLWLFWPSLGFVVFTAFTASALLISILQAVVPALVVFTLIYFISKRQQLKAFRGELGQA